MSTVLYEHPLNERIRNYLKLEQLFAQAYSCINSNISIATSHQVFFNALFSIQDTLERNDVRGDLIKDLEKLEQNLVVWSKAPQVDNKHNRQEIQQWLKLLSDISSALALILKFIRLGAEFIEIEADSGFYQDNGEGLLLLRIKLPKEAKYYPTVSGNKFRYSIRFMLPCEHTGRRYANQATIFQLARC